MADTNPTALHNSIAGSFATIILGKISASTANEIATMITIMAGTTTTIFTILKIVEWWDKWKMKKKYNRVHKNKTP